jgi:aminotransferase MxcL
MTHSSGDNGLPKRLAGSGPFERSQALFERARRVVPGVTQSMMKRPEHFAPGRFPIYLSGGRGALVRCADGFDYIDYVSGLGTNSLGHQHPALLAAVRSLLETGFNHSLPHELELTAAEKLSDLLRNAEMVRFFKTGADATSAAVRLARAITAKDHVVAVGYNGWHDHFMFDTPGVPKALAALSERRPLFVPSDEAALLERVNDGGAEIAAVVLAVPYNRVLSREFLLDLRAVCSQRGVLLIFDEIVTGFRIALAGVQDYYGVEADLACYSKALAAGMPLSAVTGPRKYLEVMERLQVSTTFGGELLSLAVCVAALEVYRSTDYVSHLATLGRCLREGVNRVATETGSPLRIIGYDAIPFFSFDPDRSRHEALMAPFQAEMAARGVILRRDVNFLSGAHTLAQVDFTVTATADSLRALGQAASH